MKKIILSLLITMTVFFVPLVAEAEMSGDRTRNSDGGGVNIAVEFLNAEETDTENLEFKINMDTHSGDLTDVNFEEKISLTDEKGNIEIDNLEWEWLSKSAHHPSAKLIIPNKDKNGNPVYHFNTNKLVLTISDLRDTDHELKWEIERPYLTVVPNEVDGSVSVIDINENEVIDTIEIGDKAGHGIAVEPHGKYLYTGDMETGELHIYDTNKKEIVSELDINVEIHGIDITPDGKYLFISPFSGGEAEENLIIFNTSENEIEKEFIDEISGSSSHVTINKEGTLAISAILGENLVEVIDIDSLEVIETIEVGEGPNEARISPDGKRAYVANWESNEITVIDMEELEVIDNVPAGKGTHGVAVSPDSNEIWTANRKSNDVTIIDAESLEVKETIASGEYANHLKFSPDGKNVMVTNAHENELAVIDRESLTIVDKIKVGNDPHEIDFIPKN